MSREEAEFLERLKHLSLVATKELLTGLDRLKNLYEERTVAQSSGRPADERQRMGDLAFRFARAELEHAEALLDVSHRQADLLFEHARGLMSGSKPDGESKRVLELVRTGDHYEGRFAVQNPFATPAVARFERTRFQSASGHLKTFKHVHVATERRTILPRKRGDVIVRVPTSSVDHRPHGAYFAELNVFLQADVERDVAHRILRIRLG